jgi:hypothetical protein
MLKADLEKENKRLKADIAILQQQYDILSSKKDVVYKRYGEVEKERWNLKAKPEALEEEARYKDDFSTKKRLDHLIEKYCFGDMQ